MSAPAPAAVAASPRVSDGSVSPLSPPATVVTPSRVAAAINGEASAGRGSSSEGGEVAALRQEVARLQLLLQASEAKVAMWEECMQQLVHCVMLSPDMNDMYKTECSTMLRDALKTVEQIQAVRFVDCSFPSVPSEAPHIQLLRWESMQDSEWQLRWAPSWSVQVAVEGQQYLQFSLTLRLFDLRLSGRMALKMSTDLSAITMSFTQPPKLRLKTECTVSWGSVPLPLQTYIETVIQDEFQRYVVDNVVSPHEMTINPESFQPKKGLTDADVKRAIEAVGLARAIADPGVQAG